MIIDHELKEAIKNRKLILFIGAGISKRCTLPLWGEVVEKILQREEIEKRLSYLDALKDEILSPLEILDKLEGKYKKNCV